MSRRPFWLAVCVASHAAWGFYPVLGRYLQVKRGLDGVALLGVTNLMALVLLKMYQAAASLVSSDNEEETDTGMFQDGVWRVGIGYSCIMICRQATNMLTVNYTFAIYAQVATQLGPFLVVPLTKMILPEEKLPQYLLPAMLLSFLGAAMVIAGQSSSLPTGFTSDDAIGLSLAGVSVVFSALMRVYMKWSEAKLDTTALASWGYLNSIPFLLVTVCRAPDSDLDSSGNGWYSRWLSLDLIDGGVIAIFTVGILMIGNFAQVSSVRHLGHLGEPFFIY